MRCLLQRVSEASVTVDGEVVGSIGAGVLALVGIGHADDEATVDRAVAKVWNLRMFSDAEGRMNRSLSELDIPEALVVSQFTLYATVNRGRRPGFGDAAPPDQARRLYERFGSGLADAGARVAWGSFGAEMAVALVNDGPVTFWVEV